MSVSQELVPELEPAFGLEGKTAVSFCGGNIASTTEPKTRFLSAESSGDVIAGAFAVLRVEFVLRNHAWASHTGHLIEAL